MDFTRTIRQAIARYLFTRQAAPGAVVDADVTEDVGRIGDGVGYGMPAVLPRLLREQLVQAGKLGAFLQESTRDTYRFQFDTPQRSDFDLPVQPVTEDPLREWDYTTREYVLTNTHAAYQRNPIAHRAVKYVSAFVIGEGFNIVYKSDKVREVVEAFIKSEDNQIRQYERQAVRDLLVDGELMLRFFVEGGQIVAVPLRPWECQWIKTERGFFRRKVEYRFHRIESEGDAPYGQTTEIENIPADEILHVAINRHTYELRGRPELYVALPYLRAYKEWLENRARQNHWRNSLLWWVKVNSTVASVVSSVAARWRRPPTPGSVAVTSANEEITPLSNTVGGVDAGEDGRQLKLMTAVALGLPEYMLSDGENANLATATVQELPALTTFGEFQQILLTDLWTPLFRRVIDTAIDAGLLPEEVDMQDFDGDPVYEDEPEDDDDEYTMPTGAPEDDDMPVQPMQPREVRKCSAREAFEVTYAPLQNVNLATLAQALQIASMNDWVSAETASTKLGFDWEAEQKRMKRERREKTEAMMNGEMPMPPGMTPNGYQQGEKLPGATAAGGGADEGRADQGDSDAAGDANEA